MAKVIKGAFIGAFIGFAAFFAFPSLGFFTFSIPGLSTALVGAAASAAAGAVAGATIGLSQQLSQFPAPDLGTALGRLNVSSNPNEVGKWVFGQTILPTDIVYAQTHGPDRQFQSLIVSVAAHEIESFGDFFAGDIQVVFAGEAGTGQWANTVWRQTRLGTSVQTAIPSLGGDDDFTIWNGEGKGIAHYRLRWQIGQPSTKQGAPRRITQVGKGAKVYDPRLDTTVGGVGAHRATDESTWEYVNGGTDIGENWALIVLYYLIGHRENGILMFGMGIDPTDIDYIQVMAAANVCEEVVDGISRFKIGGVLPTSNDHEGILRQLEGAIGGRVSQVGGKYFIWAPNDDLAFPFSRIDGKDMIKEAGVDFTPAESIEGLYNTARGRFVSPAELYQLKDYPEVVETVAVTEDGRERALSKEYALIQTGAQAQRIARYLVLRSRFTGVWTFAIGPTGLRFRPFDVTILNCIETNNVDQAVRIISMGFSITGAVVISCIEESSTIYDVTAALGISVLQKDPDFDFLNSVAVTTLASTDIALSGQAGTVVDGLKVTWDVPGTMVKQTEVQFKISTDVDYQDVPSAKVDSGVAILAPVQPGTTYDIRARHITLADIVGAYASVQDTAGVNELAFDVVNINGIPTTQVLTDIDNAKAAGRSGVGINVNKWNNGGVFRTVPANDIYFHVRLDKVSNRVYISLETGTGITLATNVNFEFEVFGQVISSFTNVALEGADIPTNNGGAVAFGIDTNVYGPNGLSATTWALTGVGSDNAFFTLDGMDDDTEVRFKIHSATKGTSGVDYGVVLGDAIFIRANLETSAPHEFFVTPTDSDKIDVLLTINAPVQPGADVTADHQGDIDNNNIVNSIRIIRQAATPDSSFENDRTLWWDISNPIEPIDKHWNGSAWVTGFPDFANVTGTTRPANNAQVNTIDAGDGLATLDGGADTKLGGIAPGADVTAGKSLTVLINRTLDNITDTGTRLAFIPTERTKLSGVATNADVTNNKTGTSKIIPSGKVWWTDTSGVLPAGNPSSTSTVTFFDTTGTQVVLRTINFHLNSSTGNITVDGIGPSSGTSVITLTGNNTTSVVVEIEAQFAGSGAKLKTFSSGVLIDTSSSGSAPVTGGGK